MGFMEIFGGDIAEEPQGDGFDCAAFTFENVVGDYLSTLKSAVTNLYLTPVVEALMTQFYVYANAGDDPGRLSQEEQAEALRVCVDYTMELDPADVGAMFSTSTLGERFGSFLMGDASDDFSLRGIVSFLVHHDGRESMAFFSSFPARYDAVFGQVIGGMHRVLSEDLGSHLRQAVRHLENAQAYREFALEYLDRDGGIDPSLLAGSAVYGFEDRERSRAGVSRPAGARPSRKGKDGGEERAFEAFLSHYDAFWHELGHIYEHNSEIASKMQQIVSANVVPVCEDLTRAVEVYCAGHARSRCEIRGHFWDLENEEMEGAISSIQDAVENENLVSLSMMADYYADILGQGASISAHWRECAREVRRAIPE